MQTNKLLAGILVMFLAISFGCKKTDFDKVVQGEALTDFRLIAPASNSLLVLNPATPNQQVQISWTAAKPGINKTPTYRWVAALKTGSLDQPIMDFPSDNFGTLTKFTLTYQLIDAALAQRGIPANSTVDIIWSITADNGTTKIRSTDTWNLSLRRSTNGASPFVLLEMASSTTPVAIDPGSTTQRFNFRWTKSQPASGGPAITYKVLFSLNGNFATPLFSINPNAVPADTTATITYKAFSDSLNAKGQTNLSQASALKWTVVATSGTWNQQSDYINDLVVLREVRMYMPGGYQSSTGNGNDWDPGTAPELIRDLRPGASNTLYYTYIFLPAGAEFKFTQGRSWDVNYGGSGGNLSGGPNLSVATSGFYRISIDRVNLKYDIREGRMGFVGGATGAGWNPPNVFPTYAMGLAAPNLFVGITNFTTGGWKLIDFNDWNNGDLTVTNARSYGSTGGSGSSLETNGANMPDITAAGPYRLIWDGRNRDNVKYEISPAVEMRIVGDGIQGVAAWTPSASPQMTYAGNGIWTRTLNLIGGKDIKFLAGNDWGAFDYEDNSGGSTATGTPRKIKWEGGDNFKTPVASGSYTITLNEYTQTVTIN